MKFTTKPYPNKQSFIAKQLINNQQLKIYKIYMPSSKNNATITSFFYVVLVLMAFKIDQIKCLQYDPLGDEISQTIFANDVIIPGKGYSSDRQQVPVVVCYNVKTLPISKAESIIHFDQGMSFTDMERQMKIDVSSSVTVGLFKGGLDVGYMRSIRDTDYSLSMNYFQKVQAQVQMQFGYGPASILTATGNQVYQNGNNPNFGLICGDKLISSYKTGAILMLSLKIQFHSTLDKQTFRSHFSISFGSIASITTDIQNTCTKYQISGRIIVQAYQLGGNPSELAKILDAKCGQHYCAAACDLSNINNCVGVVDGLLKYASGSFPNQISISQNKGLSGFPIGFATLTELKWVGLTTPKSLITQQITSSRVNLAKALNESLYYLGKIDKIIHNYPVQFIITKLPTENELKNINAMAINLNNELFSSDGAVQCYDDPEKCLSTAKRLLDLTSQLRNTVITSTALKSLKFKIPFFRCSYLYPIGFDSSNTMISNGTDNYAGKCVNTPSCTQSCVQFLKNFMTCPVFLKGSTCQLGYSLMISTNQGVHQYSIKSKMQSGIDVRDFIGIGNHVYPNNTLVEQNVHFKSEISQFYFGGYSMNQIDLNNDISPKMLVE